MMAPPILRFSGWMCCLVLVAAWVDAPAETITLVPAADTSLFDLNGGANNLGGSTTLVVGTTASGSSSRALVRFDVANSLPPQAIITSAQLNLVVIKANVAGVASIFEIHRLLQSWGEGNKTGNTGAPATAGETTWFQRFAPTNEWSVPGASAPLDFSPEASASTNVDLPNTYTFGPSSNLLEDVEMWFTNSAANFGWIIFSQSQGTNFTSRRIGAREDAVNSPTMVVDFVPPPKIVNPDRFGTNCTFHFTVEAGFDYTVEYTDTFPPFNWVALTNFTAKLASFEAGVTNSFLESSNRFFRLNRVPCNCR